MKLIKNISFDTGVKIFFAISIIEWILIIWWIFWMYDVVPDRWELFIRNLF